MTDTSVINNTRNILGKVVRGKGNSPIKETIYPNMNQFKSEVYICTTRSKHNIQWTLSQLKYEEFIMKHGQPNKEMIFENGNDFHTVQEGQESSVMNQLYVSFMLILSISTYLSDHWQQKVFT